MKPLLHLSSLQVFAKGLHEKKVMTLLLFPQKSYVEVVPLPLELSGGVHLVRHDTGDGLS